MGHITGTTREVAVARGVTLRTAQRWAKLGRLDAVKSGGRWVIALAANLDNFKPVQVDKAREAIEQGAVIPTSRSGLYFAVSSDGTTHYLVDQAERSCTCPAGARGVRCYHLASAEILTAAARRAA